MKYHEILSKYIYGEIVNHLGENEGEYNHKSILPVTFKSPRRYFSSLSEEIDEKFDRFDLFYRKICSHLAGRKYFRENEGEMPISWVFMEPGQHKLANKINHFNDLHLHTVWVIDRSRLTDLHYVANKVLEMGNPHFSQIYIDREVEFSWNETENISTAVSYASKFQRLLSRNSEMSESVRKYPDHLIAENIMVRDRREMEMLTVAPQVIS